METSAKRARVDPMSLEEKCINTIRVLAADMVEKANSGHPGAPMGCAPIAYVLWSRIMQYNTADPKWINRDRFVLSNGHACALLYSMLHLAGYEGMSMDDLKQFRQLHSKTAGHPENVLHPAIEVSTGPLGQGISNAVGLAIAEKHLGAEFEFEGRPLVDHHVYVLCGDGCLQEGISSEACSLAGHLGLGKLIVLYDDNKITIDGSTDLSFTEDVMKRYEAYGWHTQHVADGNHDVAGIEAAIRAAQAETGRPSIIKVTTSIGFGSALEGTEKVHGAPLGAAMLAEVKRRFGFDPAQSFVVDEDVRAFFEAAARRAAEPAAAFAERFRAFEAAHAEQAAEFVRREKGELPAGWMAALPRFTAADKADATRNLSGKVLNALAPRMPELLGGSADLTGSNKTDLKAVTDFQKATPHGRYIRYGVREHAMAAICNGIAAHSHLLIPYCGTFLNFIGYAAGAVRVSALSHLRVIYVGTHDSIGLGEDGPTHQPVEMLLMLRGMPKMDVYRPADGNETSACYAMALTRAHRPATLALTRQNLPHMATSSIEKAMRGGYVAYTSPTLATASAAATDDGAAAGGAGGGGAHAGRPDVVVAATGSEVAIAIEGAKLLEREGKTVQVASLPCLEVFEEQDAEYKKAVLPEGVLTVSVEAGAKLGWERYAHVQVGMDTFGMSGPYLEVYRALGITAEDVARKAAAAAAYYATRGVPALAVHAPTF